MKKQQVRQVIWQYALLRYLTYITLFLVPLYINYSHWFAFSAPKTFLTTAVVAIMLVLYAWGKWRETNSTFRISTLHIVLFGFLGVISISAYFGVDAHNSFFGTLTQSLSVSLFWVLGIFACLIGFLVQKYESFAPKLLTSTFISGVIVAFFSYLGPKAIKLSIEGSTIGNSSYAGGYLLLVFCIGIGLVFWYRKLWQKILVGMGLIMIAFSPLLFNKQLFTGQIKWMDALHNPTLFLGVANGAAIGLAVSILTVICLALSISQKRIVKIVGLMSFMLLLAGIFYTAKVFTDPSSTLHKTYVEQKSENRFTFWDIAWKGYKESPLLGNGFNNYSYTYQKHFDPKIFSEEGAPELWINQPHNMFWEYLSTTGILGLLFYCSMLGAVFIVLYRNARNADKREVLLNIALAAALVGYVIQGMFVYDTIVPLLMLFMIIGIAIGITPSVGTYHSPYKPTIVQKIFLSLIVILALGILWFFALLPSKESKQWGALVTLTQFKDLAMVRNELQDTSVAGGIGDTAFVSDKFYNLLVTALSQVDVTTEQYFIAELDSNITNLEKELEKQPNDFRAHLVTAKLLNLKVTFKKQPDKELFERTKDHLEQAMNLSPNNPQPYFPLAEGYALNGEIATARLLIVQGLELAPRYQYGIAFAQNFQKAAPDNEFGKYLASLTNK